MNNFFRYRFIKGFTLVELMVTVVVLAIVSTIGIPSLIGLVERNRTTSVANEVLGAIQFARNEAVRLNTTASICANTDCDTADWTSGWIVMRSGETVRVGSENSSVTISGPLSIQFSSAGDITSTLANIEVSSSSGNVKRCISMTRSGSAEVEVCDD